jgi:hypothetical protein
MSRRRIDVELGSMPAHEAERGDGALASAAEDCRRAGALEEALRLATDALAQDPGDVRARATAALAALDLGRDAEMRRLLEAVLEGDAPEIELEAIADDELEDAFADAEPESAAMRDANEVAYDAIRAAALDAPEGVSRGPDSPFQTRTMAALLEQQGDAAGAHTIRAALASRERGARESTRGGRRRDDRIRVLERWLERTRRGTA